MAENITNADHYGCYDVVVVGGGMAGIAAAIAAGRAGATTLLVERSGWLGGLGITGATGIHSFYNIYSAHEYAEPMRVVAGIGQDLVDCVTAMGGGMGHVHVERGGDFVSRLTPVEPETFRVAAARLCLQAGVHLLFHTYAQEVCTSSGHIDAVEVWSKSGRSVIRGSQFVDCTGDGDIAARAGAPYDVFGVDPGGESSDDETRARLGAYPTGFTFRLCNVDLDMLLTDLESRGVVRALTHAVKPGMTSPDVVRLGFSLRDQGIEGPIGGLLATSLRPRELTYCNCINYGPIDGLNADHLTSAEVALREAMLHVVSMFRKNFAGCEQCYAAGAAPAVGQRRSRAIHCEYEITRTDCTSAARFDDAVGCFSFIDHVRGVERQFVRDAGYYQIPYRALIPVGVDNLLCAGRMISHDLVVHNSTRNTACCLVCGQAAGTAAAMAARQGRTPRELEAQALRAQLVADGALLDGVVEA